jgi:hypothetical protein
MCSRHGPQSRRIQERVSVGTTDDQLQCDCDWFVGRADKQDNDDDEQRRSRRARLNCAPYESPN